jgi:hypothetical protein
VSEGSLLVFRAPHASFLGVGSFRVPHPFALLALSLEGSLERSLRRVIFKGAVFLCRCSTRPCAVDVGTLRARPNAIYWLFNSAERSRNASSISFFPSPKSKPCLTGIRIASICTREPAPSGFTVRTIR